MRSYALARAIFTFLGFCSWCLVIVGVFVAAAGAGATGFFASTGIAELAAVMAALPGIGICFAGVLGVAIVQNGRAAVDTAELSQQMLKVARDQLEVSKQALEPALRQTAFAPAVAHPARPQPVGDGGQRRSQQREQADADNVEGGAGRLMEYRGRTIELVHGRYCYDQWSFPTLSDARRYIDNENGGDLAAIAPRGRV